jgi:hypothetical protein
MDFANPLLLNKRRWLNIEMHQYYQRQILLKPEIVCVRYLFNDAVGWSRKASNDIIISDSWIGKNVEEVVA